jgi:hypothetical protein
MKSTTEIVAYLSYCIGKIYYHDRPIVYGGTAAGVELLMYMYHDIWAHAENRSDQFEQAWRAALKREDCGTLNFSGRYSLDHPEADCDEIADYVLKHWWTITKALGIPIPHEQLEIDFAEHIQVKKKQFNR